MIFSLTSLVLSVSGLVTDCCTSTNGPQRECHFGKQIHGTNGCACILRKIDPSNPAPEPIPRCFHLPKERDTTYAPQHRYGLLQTRLPFWQGPTAQYGGSLTQWSRENSRADALNSWYIFRGVGREGEKGRVRNRRNPADQRFLPLFIHCPQQRTPRDFPDDLLFILTYKC